MATDNFPLSSPLRRWFYDRSPMKVAVADNRREVTWATAPEAIEVAASSRSNGGMDVYFMTTDTEDVRAFIHDCARWSDALTPIVGDQRTSTGSFRIDFKSGYSVHAMPTYPARLRGKPNCYAILDCSPNDSDVEDWLVAAGGLRMHGSRVAIVGASLDGEFGDLVDSIKSGATPGDLHEIEATRVPAVA